MHMRYGECRNHPNRPATSKRGLCATCYTADQKRESFKRGKRCTNHPDRAVSARGLCDTCYRAWLRSVNPEYKRQRAEQTKRWERKNPDRVRAYRKAWTDARPGYRRQRAFAQRLRERGLDEFTYRRIAEDQQGRCGICGRERKRLVLDHCHDSGEARGLLCGTCNSGLGLLGDRIEDIQRALDYLRNPPAVSAKKRAA